MKKLTLLKSLLLGDILFIATSLFSQVNISGGNTVTENFDVLGTSATATMPTGWKVDKKTTVRTVGSYSSAVSKTEQSAGNTMSSSAANGIYNFGAGVAASATDRAVGGISSSGGSKSVNVYVQLTNNGSTSIDNFTISFDVEKYRNGLNAAGFSIQMYYSTDGSTWTSAGSDFIASFAKDADNDGYSSAPGTTISISSKILPQSLAAGASLYLAWNYSVTSGTTTSNAQALGIDNVSITANTAPAIPVVATPIFSPEAGTYTSAQSITISCTTEGASIYYTKDGTDPNNTSNGTLYSSPISVSATTTIKAIAYADGYDPSAVASATYIINTAPTITVTEATLPVFIATAGSSQSQSITVNGTNLTGDITLELLGTDAAMFSLSQNSITPSRGSVTNQVIIITYAPTASGNHTATLTLSSTDATDVVRDLSGSATLLKPVTTAPSTTKNSLTLNWNAVTGAAEYVVNVYTKDFSGELTLLSEDFSNFKAGSTGSGADSKDISGSLDSLTLVPGWSGYKVFQAGETVKVGTSSALGYLVTPSLDLSGGEVTLFFKAMAWLGDTTDLKIYLNDALAYTQSSLNNTDYTLNSYSTTLTGGTATSKIKFEGKQASKGRFFLDDIVVTKKNYTPVPGSPFTTTETSLQVSGLTPATTYYYTVMAKSGSYVSPASDEASVSTLGTATPNVNVQGIFVRNGKVIVTASAAGQRIEVYNTLGQRLVNVVSKEGENEISVPSKGIFMVKCGTEINKIILP